MLLSEYSGRSQLRAWLRENHPEEKECRVVMSRSKTPPAGVLPYIDVVEEALCFGWIDSTRKKLPDGPSGTTYPPSLQESRPMNSNSANGSAVLKSPLSGSGKGIRFIRERLSDSDKRFLDLPGFRQGLPGRICRNLACLREAAGKQT